MKCQRKWLFIILSVFFMTGIIWIWREGINKDGIVKEISQDEAESVSDNRKFQYQKVIKMNKRLFPVENKNREVLRFGGE